MISYREMISPLPTCMSRPLTVFLSYQQYVYFMGWIVHRNVQQWPSTCRYSGPVAFASFWISTLSFLALSLPYHYTIHL